MGWVRGSQGSPSRWHEELLRTRGSKWVMYVTAVALVEVLLHLGVRSNPSKCYVRNGTLAFCGRWSEAWATSLPGYIQRAQAAPGS